MTSRPVDHTAQAVVGYTDRWSVRPGESFDVFASATSAAGSARLVRFGHDGAAWTASEEPGSAEQTVALRHESFRFGSYLEADGVAIPPEGVVVSVWLYLTKLPDTVAEVVGIDGGPSLQLRADGTLAFEGATSPALATHRWLLVKAGVSPGASTYVRVRPKRPHPLEPADARSDGPAWNGSLPVRARVRFGDGLDGRMDLPSLARWPGGDDELLHEWDASVAPGSPEVPDVVGFHAAHLVGMPLQLCQGVRHGGRSNDPAVDPQGHSAVHVHSDDLEDAGWPSVATVTVPAGCPSGVVAAEITTDDGVERLPVVVRGPGTAPVLVLLPTLTYMAYANEHANPPELPGKVPETSADFGRANGLGSWYDQHRDGSRWWLLTSRRPLMGIRPEHRFRVLGGEHGLSHDLMLLGWLERRGIEFEVACDHDLDREGVELLRQHRVVLTGAHPEYWTAPMLDALETYLDDGGRLAYLGGNGFLWTAAVDPDRPWVHECRKSFADNALVDREVGADHLQITGQRAGMWQTVDRPPAALVGVATTAMGFDGAGHYVRSAASRDARVERIFRGIASETFGDHGAILGGAAGYEVDLASPDLGTPCHALVLATATVPDNYMTFAPSPFPSPMGETLRSRRRSDVVFFETPHGGRVFSVGSIMWTDAMRSNHDDNDVSRITENVVRWFAEAP